MRLTTFQATFQRVLSLLGLTSLSSTVEQHICSVHIRTPRIIWFQYYPTIAFRFVCCCHFLITVEVDSDLNGSRPTNGVRKSASLIVSHPFWFVIHSTNTNGSLHVQHLLERRPRLQTLKCTSVVPAEADDHVWSLLPTHTRSLVMRHVSRSHRVDLDR